jgi:hypothetical protein
VPQAEGVSALVELIKADGKWQDPPEGWVAPEPPKEYAARIQIQSRR